MNGIARADESIGAAALKEILSGNTSIGSTSKGTPFWLHRAEDGSQAVETDSGFTDKGKWWVTDDGKVYSEWEKIRDGVKYCAKVFRVGKNRYRTTRANGGNNDFKVVKGNPEGL